MESRYWILILLELELTFIICDTLSIIVLLSSIGSLNFNSDNKDVFFYFCYLQYHQYENTRFIQT